MRKVRIPVIFMILIIFSLSSCTKKTNNSNYRPDESERIIRLLEDYEMALINIMSKVDLVPYYEKQIKEKEMEKKEKRQEELSSGTKDKEDNSGKKSEGNKEKFKPKPITDNDVVLLKILEQEKSYKSNEQEEREIPDDIIFIWYVINTQIGQLHLKWDELKPKLKNDGDINGFDETLNSLTISSNKNKYMDTLIYANKLTSYIFQYIKDLDNKVLASIYSIKYLTRQIALDVANNNYNTANKNMKAIKNDEKILISHLLKKKNKDLLDKLNYSVDNLEKAISTKDLNVIKIKASIIIKNIITIRDELSM